MRREARALAKLTHPNVVHVYEIGEHQGRVFIAMEYVRGESLAGWLRSRTPPWRGALEAYLAAGEGLAAAHAVGLVHRDFKPENVLRGEDGRVWVADFGLARTPWIFFAERSYKLLASARVALSVGRTDQAEELAEDAQRAGESLADLALALAARTLRAQRRIEGVSASAA